MGLERRDSYFWGKVRLKPKPVDPGTVVNLGLGSEMRVQEPDVVVVIEPNTGSWEGYETKTELKGSEINERHLRAEGGLIDLITGHNIEYQWAPH